MYHHLTELKNRATKILIILSVTFGALFIFSKDLYTLLAKPLFKALPQNGAMVATQITTPFIVPMKLSFYMALYLVIPVIMYHIWSFVGPALYKHERRYLLPLVTSSCILFYVGTLFAYIILCPISLKFFSSCVPQNILMLTDISSYLDYLLALTLGGGVAFQIPVITVVSNKLQLINKDALAKLRRHIIVASFILGMLLTPPDVISQIILALPIWGLYELSLLACK